MSDRVWEAMRTQKIAGAVAGLIVIASTASMLAWIGRQPSATLNPSIVDEVYIIFYLIIPLLLLYYLFLDYLNVNKRKLLIWWKGTRTRIIEQSLTSLITRCKFG